MKVLLDTHAWLWLLSEPERFGTATLAMLSDRENELYLSAASTWEIAIKWGLGKLELPDPPAQYVPDRLRRSGVEARPVTVAQTLAVAALPPHHRDPFDRLLIAHAQLEGLQVLTADPAFSRYEVPVLSPDA